MTVTGTTFPDHAPVNSIRKCQKVPKLHNSSFNVTLDLYEKTMSLNHYINIIITTALQNKCITKNTVGLILTTVEI